MGDNLNDRERNVHRLIKRDKICGIGLECKIELRSLGC